MSVFGKCEFCGEYDDLMWVKGHLICGVCEDDVEYQDEIDQEAEDQ